MDGEKVARFLYSWKIFDEDDKDRVCAQTTRSDQNYKLLDLILHKGPMAYKQFRQALMKTNSQHLVDLLDKSPGKLDILQFVVDVVVTYTFHCWKIRMRNACFLAFNRRLTSENF